MSCPSDIERIQQLEAEVDFLKSLIKPEQNPYREGPIRMTPQLAELLNVLMQGEVVRHARILQALTIHSYRGQYDSTALEEAAVKVAVSRLRKVLKPHGVMIKNRNGIGYLIDATDKRKVRELFRAPNHDRN